MASTAPKFNIRRAYAIRAAMAAKAGTAPVGTSEPKAPKVKRPRSEAQILAWNTIIKPSYDAGRARKRAEREAAAAEAVAVAA